MMYMTRVWYKAESDNNAWGEHEIDYFLIIQKDVELDPDPNEVKSYFYIGRDEFQDFIGMNRFWKSCNLNPNFFISPENTEKVSPWFKIVGKRFLYQWWDNLDNLKK